MRLGNNIKSTYTLKYNIFVGNVVCGKCVPTSIPSRDYQQSKIVCFVNFDTATLCSGDQI